jgi:hypothetical protein
VTRTGTAFTGKAWGERLRAEDPDRGRPEGVMNLAFRTGPQRICLAPLTNGIEVTLRTDQQAVADDGRRRQGELVK